MNKKGTLLLIDFLNLFYKGFCVHSSLNYNGVNTGGLYGMAMQLANMLKKIEPDHIAFCYDSKPYLRSNDFPDYKIDRKKKEKDIHRAQAIQNGREMCLEFVKILGMPLLESDGLEADDIIALMVKKYNSKYERIVVSSNDDDLFQLLEFKNLELYRGGKKGFYSYLDFEKDYPALSNPSQWCDVTSYAGGHNGLPGINGIGIATAIRIITEKGFLSKKPKLEVAIKNNSRQIAINNKLAKLPYYKCPENIMMRIPSRSKYNERDAIRFLGKYGITFTHVMRDAFSGK